MLCSFQPSVTRRGNAGKKQNTLEGMNAVLFGAKSNISRFFRDLRNLALSSTWLYYCMTFIPGCWAPFPSHSAIVVCHLPTMHIGQLNVTWHHVTLRGQLVADDIHPDDIRLETRQLLTAVWRDNFNNRSSPGSEIRRDLARFESPRCPVGWRLDRLGGRLTALHYSNRWDLSCSDIIRRYVVPCWDSRRHFHPNVLGFPANMGCSLATWNLDSPIDLYCKIHVQVIYVVGVCPGELWAKKLGVEVTFPWWGSFQEMAWATW